MTTRSIARDLLLAGALTFATALPSAAQFDNTGAALALPFITTGGSVTQINLVNTEPTGVVVEFRLIEGEGGNWDVESYQCALTGNEVVTIAVSPVLVGRSQFESTSLGCNTLRIADAANGIFFVSVQGDQANRLQGTATVIEPLGPVYSVDAIPFRSGPVLNTDDVFVFDGLEYERFPARLHGQFVVPAPTFGISSELILFTLDGAAGFPPDVNLNLTLRDDNGTERTVAHAFSCFTVVGISAIDPTFTRSFVSSNTASLEIVPTSTGATTQPVLGWVVNRIFAAASFDSATAPMTTSGAGAERLVGSLESFVPEAGGLVRFDDD